jgi:type IV secretory pathway protease TraF
MKISISGAYFSAVETVVGFFNTTQSAQIGRFLDYANPGTAGRPLTKGQSVLACRATQRLSKASRTRH